MDILKQDFTAAHAARVEARHTIQASEITSGRLPDFVVAGFAKCGTSTLFAYLRRHPQVFCPYIKEPDFFNAAAAWSRGLDWYRSLFAAAEPDQICGEASTSYTRLPQIQHVPDRMVEIIPKVKLIYIMRHPIDRAYSHYVHRYTKEVNRGKPFLKNFDEFVKDDPICVDTSEYLMQIENYLRVFRREQMLFLLTEDLETNPRICLQEICRFLGINAELDLLADGPIFANLAKTMDYHRVRVAITSPLKRNSFLRGLAAIAPRFLKDWGFGQIRRSRKGQKLEKAFTAPPMSPQSRENLAERYRPGIERLANFLGRDLSHWQI